MAAVDPSILLKGPHIDLLTDGKTRSALRHWAAARKAPGTYEEELKCLA